MAEVTRKHIKNRVSFLETKVPRYASYLGVAAILAASSGRVERFVRSGSGTDRSTGRQNACRSTEQQ